MTKRKMKGKNLTAQKGWSTIMRQAARQLSSGKKTSKSPHDVPDPCANSQFQGL